MQPQLRLMTCWQSQLTMFGLLALPTGTELRDTAITEVGLHCTGMARVGVVFLSLPFRTVVMPSVQYLHRDRMISGLSVGVTMARVALCIGTALSGALCQTPLLMVRVRT